MLRIKEYLGCGNIYIQPKTSTVRLNVTKKSDLTNIIIPFFKKYPLQGSKRLDFGDFSIIEEIIQDNFHITEEGLNKIGIIKNRMNSKRIHEG
jgi:hypothetical protein